MDTLPDLPPDNWVLVIAPHAAAPLMLELIARLAHLGPVRVLDGGDRFQARSVAREIQRDIPDTGPGLHAYLKRIYLARAFTCYQMVALLAGTPASRTPSLVLDLLSTFYDESVPLAESRRLLTVCLTHIKRLASQGPLAISARPPRVANDRISLVEILTAAADQVYRMETHIPTPPPSLW